MSYYNYYETKSDWFYAWEYSPGVLVSGRDQYATNQAADVFYNIPIITHSGPLHRNELDMDIAWSAGSSYPSHIEKGRYKEVLISLTGKIVSHEWLLPGITDFCTNTGAEAPYTHQADNADTIPAQPITICLLRKLVNSTAGETKYLLYPSTLITNGDEYQEKGMMSMLATYNLIANRVVDGVAPTSEPTRTLKTPLSIYNSASSVTWTNAATTYQYKWKSWFMHFSANKRQTIIAGSEHPTDVEHASKRDFYCKIGVLPRETDTYDDSQDDPHSGGNKDLACKIGSNATTNYILYTFGDIYQKIDGTTFDRVLEESHIARLNPHDDSSTWDVTEKNSKTSANYELPT